MFTKEIAAKVVGFRTYKGTKDDKEYEIKYANIVYEDEENKYIEGCTVDSYKYNHKRLDLTEGTYNLLLIGQKAEKRYIYEIIGATRLDK